MSHRPYHLQLPSSYPKRAAMGLPRFGRPEGGGGGGGPSPNLYVANCGPAVGISHDEIRSVFGVFGPVKGVYAADDSGARVVVCFDGEVSARAALEALNGRPCPDLGGRSLHVRYSVERPVCQVRLSQSPSIPGVVCKPGSRDAFPVISATHWSRRFVSLSCSAVSVDSRAIRWHSLSCRNVSVGLRAIRLHWSGMSWIA